jgi:hypothetical protein
MNDQSSVESLLEEAQREANAKVAHEARGNRTTIDTSSDPRQTPRSREQRGGTALAALVCHHPYIMSIRNMTNIRSIAGVKSTPKSTKGSAKKRAAIAKRTTEDVEDEAGATPTKKPRKSPAKKKVVASPNGEEERLAKESWLRRIKVCCACFVSVCIEEVVL